MLNEPTLSACIVLYHAGDEALQAVRCLDESDLAVTVYLVDNSPQDDTAQRIAWMCPGVRVLPQDHNLGFGRANNQVLDLLKSDYHLLCNPDVTFDKNLLTRMVAYMDAHPDVTVLTPRVLNPDGSEQFLPKLQPSVRFLLGGFLENLGGPFRAWRKEYTMEDKHVARPIDADFATGCFLLIRTKTFLRLHGFDPRFFLYQEDSDLCRRVLAEGGKIVYHPDMCVTHLWARENKRTFRGVMRQTSSVCRYFFKWGWKW